MFKKKVKVSQSHAISNKDRKGLKEQMVVKQQFDAKGVDKLLDGEIQCCKLQGLKAVLYQKDKAPLFFAMNSKPGTEVLPTGIKLCLSLVYALLECPNLVPNKVFINLGVDDFVFKGADLMFPGIKSIEPPEFKQNQVAVIFSKNARISSQEWIPIAVGRFLVNEVQEKGRAIQSEHYMFDELWNMGSMQIPDQIQLPPSHTSEEKKKQEEFPALESAVEE